jgi:hypothetical protein
MTGMERRVWDVGSAAAELLALVGLDPAAGMDAELRLALSGDLDSAAGEIVALIGEESGIVARARAVQIFAGLRAAGR